MQRFYEEMMQRCPRRGLLQNYANELLRRFPSMKPQVRCAERVRDQAETGGETMPE